MRRFLDEVHRHLAHRFVVLDFEQFEPVGDGADRRDHVVADAAAQKRGKVEIAQAWLDVHRLAFS